MTTTAQFTPADLVDSLNAGGIDYETGFVVLLRQHGIEDVPEACLRDLAVYAREASK